jgi:hypothetical protein
MREDTPSLFDLPGPGRTHGRTHHTLELGLLGGVVGRFLLAREARLEQRRIGRRRKEAVLPRRT